MTTPRIRKDPRTGFYVVGLKTPRGRQWLSTGERTRDRAMTVCDEAMIEKLQLAANAGVLNADAVSRLTTGRRFTCSDVLAAWKAEAEIDLAPDTVARYHETLSLFFAEAEIATRPVHTVSRATLDRFVNARGISAGTRRGRLAAARSFFSFARAAAYCVTNIADRVITRTRDLHFLDIEKKETPPITEEEFRTIMASPKFTGFYRWGAAFGWWFGLRIRDVACFEWDSLKAQSIIVHTRKRGKRLELPLDEPLFGGGEIRRIITEMLEADKIHPKYCFPEERVTVLDTAQRAQLSTGFIRRLNRVGIRGKSFHGLRHAFGTRLDASGKTIEQIAEAMAHSQTETTQGYIHHS